MNYENMKNAISISSAGNIAFATILCFVGVVRIARNTLAIIVFAKEQVLIYFNYKTLKIFF